MPLPSSASGIHFVSRGRVPSRRWMVPHAGASDHEEVVMSDSYRLGWPPAPRPDASEPEAVPCARCGHRADSHVHPGSCSVRGRW